MVEHNLVELREQLSKLKAEYDPMYMYSDDFTFYTHQSRLRSLINSLEATIGSIEKSV